MITIFRLFEKQIQDFWYHGSHEDFDRFRCKQGTLWDPYYNNSPIFLTSDKYFAEGYGLCKGGMLYTVKVLTDKIFNVKSLPFDIDIYRYEEKGIKKPDLDYDTGIKLRNYIDTIFDDDIDTSRKYNNLLSGDYSYIEEVWFFEWLKQNKFDGCYIYEGGTLNLMIFDPNKIDIVKKERLDSFESINYKFNNDYDSLRYKKHLDVINNAKIGDILVNETIYLYVEYLVTHGEKNDYDNCFVDGDLGERLDEYDKYQLKEISIDDIDLDEWELDDYYTDIYKTKYIDNKDYPPIVVGSEYSIIDGLHRANALKESGLEKIKAFVGI